MDNNELYHFGVRGMKWGHRKKTDTGKSKSNSGHTILYDHYLIKQDKRKQQTSGDRANIKYMTDAERIRYAKGRVKNMGSKAQAIRSESTNFAARTGITALKGVAATLTSTVGVACTAASMAKGAYVMTNLLQGAIVGAVPLAAISLTALSAQTIARGVRYMKNVNAIKNAKK